MNKFGHIIPGSAFKPHDSRSVYARAQCFDKAGRTAGEFRGWLEPNDSFIVIQVHEHANKEDVSFDVFIMSSHTHRICWTSSNYIISGCDRISP